jgi:UDP-N-acetylmuramoyl-L-alanyl-D-glutamate--2,6-diaminopimelate ligase
MALRLPLLGVTQVVNAAMAATAALLLGVSPESVRRGLAGANPIHRRMEVVRTSRPLVIDDTVGNPRSLEAVFETIRHIRHNGQLRVLFGIRGMRGTQINTRLAATLAECIGPYACLVITSSNDFADARNKVLPAERDAFIDSFRAQANGRPFEFQPSLRDAVKAVLEGVDEGDLVLLLGAQGLDAAAPLVIETLQ